ncbi:hypothetical protein [Streptomyces coelicoflavus]|uniref:hypothetical protein n=1 Tax=Streptomyces coelicoflavus TaxID=285562 RepID=UPI0036457EF5
MPSHASPDRVRIADEDMVIEYVRQHAKLAEGASCIPNDWAYPTSFHLLLALGRRFTPAPGNDVVDMPERLCYSNAARYARAHRDEGLVYAEGFALIPAAPDVSLPHAWVVRPDGTVLDPTWNDAHGRAYIGVPVRDPRLWPGSGSGLLEDHQQVLPLLRNGFPRNALADLGRPLISDGA